MFKRWERDKWKHFFVGIPLGVILQFTAMHFFSDNISLASFLALVALSGICYAFEVVSRVTGKGHYEIMDAIAGILGGVIGMVAIWAFI